MKDVSEMSNLKSTSFDCMSCFAIRYGNAYLLEDDVLFVSGYIIFGKREQLQFYEIKTRFKIPASERVSQGFMVDFIGRFVVFCVKILSRVNFGITMRRS